MTDLIDMARFRSIDGPTVLTKRNFGLTRGRSLQDAANLLQHFVSNPTRVDAGGGGDRKRQQNSVSSSSVTSSSPSNSGASSPRNGNRFGQGGFGDRSANVWDWPLGRVTIVNRERSFEALLTISPFSCDDITATVMGSELFIQCRDGSGECGRELSRSYQLPLNIEPRSVRFRFKQRRFLLVTADKELPLKLAVAFAPSDEEELSS